MKPVAYVSTLGGRATDFADALFRGQAPDGGLFVPASLPTINVESLVGMDYSQTSRAVMSAFADVDVDYDFAPRFEPTTQTAWTWMRLDTGPTASFKDFAARFMARAMTALRKRERLTILVATSGDTGGAVAHAFYALDGVRVFVLYPKNEVSPEQKRQLDSFGQNVVAFSVAGKFDDCQRMVKTAFADPTLAALNLTSANSINVARVLPQSVYYFYAYARLRAEGALKVGERLTFCVPSGNAGNALGAELARRMGLPVAKIVMAFNANDAVPQFLQTGVYRPVSPSKVCDSNAMNVGHPSNWARFVHFYGGTLLPNGTTTKMPDLAQMRRRLSAASVSDALTRQTVVEYYRQTGQIIEPHGAVGWAVAQNLDGPGVCLETAHPAKFSDYIERVLGVKPEPPPSHVVQQTFPPVEIGADYNEFKAQLCRLTNMD
jgi:threonine synthase